MYVFALCTEKGWKVGMIKALAGAVFGEAYYFYIFA